MILFLRKFFFIFVIFNFKSKKNITFNNLNFKRIDFTNNQQVKSYIFKKNFYINKNKNIHSFDFLNFSKKLGGKLGIKLSKESIFGWYKINKNKINFPWTEDLCSRRLINLLYNYEYINSSLSISDKKKLDSIIFFHMQRVLFDYKTKNSNDITSFDLLAFLLSSFTLRQVNQNK